METRSTLAEKSIYVDLDDVLAQTGRMFLEVLARDFGREIDIEQVVDYDLGPDSLETFMRRVHEPENLSSIEPMPGARRALEQWAEEGYEIEVVTGRPMVTRGDSKRWLEAARLPHHALTFVKKYVWSEDMFSEDGALPLRAVVERGFSLIVEDSAEVAARLAEDGATPVVLLDRPWNRDQVDLLEEAGRIHRCETWVEIAQRFARP